MATRFYLPASGAAPVSPVFTHQAAWTEVDGAVRRRMETVKRSTTMASLSLGFANTAGTKQLYVQFVSDPLDVQTVSGAATFKGTVRGLESGVNDNIDAVSCKVIVVSEDGTTLRGTLANLANYGPVAELSTSLRAKRIADGDTLTAGITTQRGDRLVVEVGLTTTVGGTSITGDMSFGDDAASDLGDNETDTAADNPFVEFSHTFVFLDSPSELDQLVGSGGLIGRRWR